MQSILCAVNWLSQKIIFHQIQHSPNCIRPGDSRCGEGGRFDSTQRLVREHNKIFPKKMGFGPLGMKFTKSISVQRSHSYIFPVSESSDFLNLHCSLYQVGNTRSIRNGLDLVQLRKPTISADEDVGFEKENLSLILGKLRRRT